MRDSDGTLTIRPVQQADPGTDWTVQAAERHGRPSYVLEVPADGGMDINSEMLKVSAWIREHGIRVLNVAGPSDRTAPTMGDWAYRFLVGLISQCRASPGRRMSR